MEVLNRQPFIRAHIDLTEDVPQKNSKHNVKTIIDLLDHNALHNAEHIFCYQAKKCVEDDLGFVSISHAMLRKAVEVCAAFIYHDLAHLQEKDKQSPVALLLESDMGLLIHKLALIRLGIPVLLLSTRLSPDAIKHLVSSTKANVIITSSRTQHIAKESTGDLYIYEAETLDTLLNVAAKTHTSSLSQCNREITNRDVLILHSSGTTGLPKPIYQSHKYLLAFSSCHLQSDEKESQALNVSTLPLFHGFGLVAPGLAFGIGKTLCLPASSVPITGESVLALLKACSASSLMSVPSILEEIAVMSKSNELKKLNFVAFGGGQLKSTVGEHLAQEGIKLLNHYGTTECGPLSPIFIPDDEYNWRFFRLRRDIPVEVVAIPSTRDEETRYKLIMYPYGWNTPFEIQDQLVTSKENPGNDFNAIGRNDALILLATGEKVVPAILENALMELPMISTAIALGVGQFELAILIQPMQHIPTEDYENFKDRIWPIIRKAGESMDAHARLSSKDAILLIAHDTPLPRSDKGSILRNKVYEQFSIEISALYKQLNSEDSSQLARPLRAHNLMSDIKRLIQTALPHWRLKSEQWTDDDDFFELGMDSLQALQLRRILRASLTDNDRGLLSKKDLPANIVHVHSSVRTLADALSGSKSKIDIKTIDDYVGKYSHHKSDATFLRPIVILLTGSTGSFGSHLLANLVRKTNNSRIICLNRTAGDKLPIQKQKRSMQEKMLLLTESEWSRIHVIEANMDEQCLGIPLSDYAWLCQTVTHIVHCAWPMDFQRQLHSFESQFQITRNLIEFSNHISTTRSPLQSRLIFISSVAVIGQSSAFAPASTVLEKSVHDERWAIDSGYAKAKLVCERLIEKASQDETGEFAIVRLGQISGSKSTGFWNVKEHIPQLLSWSHRVLALPDLHGTLSWLPVDSAAAATTEILMSSEVISGVYHLENPIRQPWQSILIPLIEQLQDLEPNQQLTLVSYSDWLEKVCRLMSSCVRSEVLSVEQLLGFFENDFERMSDGSVVMATERMQTVSETLRNAREIDRHDLQQSVNYWLDLGFFSSTPKKK